MLTMDDYGRVYQRLSIAEKHLKNPVCNTGDLSVHKERTIESVLASIEAAQEFLNRWREEKGEPNGKLQSVYSGGWGAVQSLP